VCTGLSDPVNYLAVHTGSLQTGEFLVYPNPTNEWITLRIPEKLQNTVLFISIMDINARYILEDEASLYLGQYSAGIYNYIIENKVTGKIYRGQFILQ